MQGWLQHFCYLGGRDAGGKRWLEGDEEQNGGLQTPNKGERSTLQSVSPENAAVGGQAAGRRLFGLKREQLHYLLLLAFPPINLMICGRYWLVGGAL